MRVTLCFRPPFCLLPLGFLLAPFVLTTPLNFLSSFNVSFHLRREEEKGRREEEEEGGRRNEKTEGEGRREEEEEGVRRREGEACERRTNVGSYREDIYLV